MTTIFRDFQGADLDRLIDCLVAIRKAGLSVDEHTQASVNQNSGNVWVWDDDWAGCVYCSIDFETKWSWSCANCGQEHDFDTYQEMVDFADLQNTVTNYEGCEHCHE